MTERERIIVSVCTGILLCDFQKLHEYAEEKLQRPIFTHEFAIDSIMEKLIKEAKQKDEIIKRLIKKKNKLQAQIYKLKEGERK